MPAGRKRSVRPRTGAKRTPFTIQLHPENDADIIDYLNHHRNKQAAIKDALRSCINGLPPSESDDFQIAIGDLRGYLDQKFAETQRLIRSAPVNSVQQPRHDETPELDQGMKKALIKGFKPGF